MKNIATTIAYASAWIATSIAVIFAIKYTESAWCLWALLFPACIKASVDISTSNDGDDNEEDQTIISCERKRQIYGNKIYV